MMKKIKKRSVQEESGILNAAEHESSDDYLLKRMGVLDFAASDGVDAGKYEYLVINDGGIDVYAMCIYILRLPPKTFFATTFAPLFAACPVSNVFITPLGEIKSQRIVDKRVKTLDVELTEAIDSGDTNRIRKMQTKFQKAQEWAQKIESGDNALYNVQFLFTVLAESRKELYRKVSDLRARALQSGVEIAACYALQTEAFISTYPLNRVEQFKGADFITSHVLDRRSLGDIFNHTTCSFTHKNGVFLGHYLDSKRAFLYDPFDISHDGYSAIFAGGTGTGKSLSVKAMQSRMVDFGVRFRTLDIESRASHGEYTLTSYACGGINFDIRLNGANKLNPFDINEEMEFDEGSGIEYPVLRLAEKRAYLVDLFMSMVKIGVKEISAQLDKAMASILTDICNVLYNEREIYDGKPESLYASSGDDFLGSGRVKKKMPTISDAFKLLLLKKKMNDNHLHDEAYQVLADTLRDQVSELYYGAESIRFFTREEYEAMGFSENGLKCVEYEGKTETVIPVIGSKSYFDGQSTLQASAETPYINYDISQIPESDRRFATLVVLGYMEETDIKMNSANPLRAKPLIITMDEVHTLFPYENARRCIDRFYRCCRKRFCGCWVLTQSLKDFGNEERYPELAGVFKNTDSYFLFRHKTADRDFLQKNTDLTPSQVERVFALGVDPTDPEITKEEKKRRSGEVCVIDRGRVAFVKVDYLEESEARFVETNAEVIRSWYADTKGVQNG